MKNLIPVLFLFSLLLGSCANDTPVISADDLKPAQTAKHHHEPVKKGACADPQAPPLSQCSATVSATFDSQGTLWIAWVNNKHLYIQFSKDKGKSFSAPLPVNSSPEDIASKDESRPKIKVDAQGVIYLSWVLTLDKKRSTYVRFSRSIDGGQHFSTPVTVNDNQEIIRHRFDTLTLGKNGEIFIAWLDARHTEAAKKTGAEFDGLSLYYTWSDDGGKHFYPNKKIADHTCECCRLDSAITRDNTPVIVWRHIFEGGIRDHGLVNFKDWNTPGELRHLGAEHWKIDACPHHGPGLAIAEDNRYHAVWFSNSESRQGLFYASSNDAGQSFSEPFNFGGKGASHPHVLALAQRIKVVWQEFDGQLNLIKLMRSIDAGQTWSAPETVAQTSAMIDEPFLVSDGRHSYLSWLAQQEGYQLKLLEN